MVVCSDKSEQKVNTTMKSISSLVAMDVIAMFGQPSSPDCALLPPPWPHLSPAPLPSLPLAVRHWWWRHFCPTPATLTSSSQHNPAITGQCWFGGGGILRTIIIALVVG
jgi:hypothetical protein